jgi:hypothetical protein
MPEEYENYIKKCTYCKKKMDLKKGANPLLNNGKWYCSEECMGHGSKRLDQF